MILLIKIIMAHFIGDFVLQPKSWVEEKEKNGIKSSKLYWHILIHGVLFLILTWNINNWFWAVLLMILHGVIDVLKLYLQKENNRTSWFLLDQGMHMISIMTLWYFWTKPSFKLLEFSANSNIWIFAAALLFLTMVSGIFIQVMMINWSNALNEHDDESLVNAGKYIGILERLFVFTFVVLGNWEAIGFLLAAKSIFRFGDLKEAKDRKLTEYILIGTLLSFGIAIAVGLLVLNLTEIM